MLKREVFCRCICWSFLVSLKPKVEFLKPKKHVPVRFPRALHSNQWMETCTKSHITNITLIFIYWHVIGMPDFTKGNIINAYIRFFFSYLRFIYHYIMSPFIFLLFIGFKPEPFTHCHKMRKSYYKMP